MKAEERDRAITEGVRSKLQELDDVQRLCTSLTFGTIVKVHNTKYNETCTGKVESIQRRENPHGKQDVAFTVRSSNYEYNPETFKEGHREQLNTWYSLCTIEGIIQ